MFFFGSKRTFVLWKKIKEMPPGSFYKEKVNPYFRWKKLPLFRGELKIVAQKLRDKLSKAVKRESKVTQQVLCFPGSRF